MGKQVLVTGGSRGIGAATVRALAEAGYDVEFTFRESEETATALASDLGRRFADQDISCRQVDLLERDQVDALADDLVRRKELYGLVHSAGMTYDALAAMINQDRAAEIMQVNFWSLTRLVSSALRPMIRARSGRVVALGSIVAARGTQGNASYAASKGALQSYMRTLSLEVAARGVTANVIAPGYVETDMIAPYLKRRDGIEKQIPVGRFARAEEVAGLVAYLLSDAAGYVNGVAIPIDGGLSAAVAVGRS